MSLILKGIDIPEDVRGELILDDIRIIFSNANARSSISLDKDDIIQIPTPHGRLIDGDKVVKEYYINPTYPSLCTVLNNAPTILEAEEA